MQTDSHSYETGDLVNIGDHAGFVGNTGLSFCAHLHLVIMKEGVAIDPLPFLAENA